MDGTFIAIIIIAVFITIVIIYSFLFKKYITYKFTKATTIGIICLFIIYLLLSCSFAFLCVYTTPPRPFFQLNQSRETTAHLQWSTLGYFCLLKRDFSSPMSQCSCLMLSLYKFISKSKEELRSLLYR